MPLCWLWQRKIELAVGDLPAAAVAIKAVAAAVQANPFTLMQRAVAALEQRIAEAQAARPVSQPS